MEIAAFDIVEIGEPLDNLLDLEAREPKNPNFPTLGLESIFLVNNMGTLAIAYFIWFVAAICALFVKIGVDRSKRFKKLYRKMKRKLFYNSLISLFVESYSLLAVCCLINISYISFESYGYTFHSVMCIIFFAAIILWPIMLFTHLGSSFVELEHPHYKLQYGNLYEDLNLREGSQVLL